MASEIVTIIEELNSQGIIHRDLKPDNLIFDAHMHLKAIDFGASEVFPMKGQNDELFLRYLTNREKFILKEDSPTKSASLAERRCRISTNFLQEYNNSLNFRKSLVGTIYYVSPEMIQNNLVDRGCDLWALGVIIYKCISGRHPFQGANDLETFELIQKCDLKFDDQFTDLSKSLISNLLRLKSSERLGNRDGSNTLAELKRHPFFSSVNWSQVYSSASILKLETVSPRLGNLQEFEELSRLHRKGNARSIVYSGVVRKKANLILYKNRQLILYNDKTLEYLDPDTNEVRGRITITKSTVCSIRDSWLVIADDKRTYEFEPLDCSPELWRTKITETGTR